MKRFEFVTAFDMKASGFPEGAAVTILPTAYVKALEALFEIAFDEQTWLCMEVLRGVATMACGHRQGHRRGWVLDPSLKCWECRIDSALTAIRLARIAD